MRFNDVNLTDYMWDRMDKLKKVKELSVSKDEFVKMIQTIDYINGVDKYETRVGQYDLSKYEIPSQLADMILPCEIKYADDRKYLNLKSSEYKNEENETFNDLLNPNDFAILWESLFSAMRIKVDFKPVTEFRGTKTIKDVSSRVTDSGHYFVESGEPCVPIFLDYNIFESRFYSYDVDDAFKEWFKDVLLKSKQSN